MIVFQDQWNLTFFQDYELVRKREVDEIVNLVKNILKEGEIIKKKKIIEKKDEKENKEGKSLRDELWPLCDLFCWLWTYLNFVKMQPKIYFYILLH